MAYTPLVNGDTNATLRAKINAAFTSIDAMETKINAHTSSSKACTSITTQNLFTISEGSIKVASIVGYITEAFAAGANNVKLVYTATGGAAVDLCAVLNVASSAIRKCLTITGVKANALALSADEGVSLVVDGTSAYIRLQPGVISMNCSATTTGQVTWEIDYEPIVGTSVVTSA